MHFFVVIFDDGPPDPRDAQRLIAGALDYAIDHKGGLPRGVQTGTITFPALITASPSRELVDWATDEPHGRFGAILLPVLADADAHHLYWYTGRLSKGYYFQQDMHDTVTRLIAPGLGATAKG